jgi:hypothetical protein
MAEQLYDLTFSGELLEGYFIDFVKADLQTLFKVNEAYIDALFSGPNQTVKLKVNKATAIKYQKAFKQAGAKLIVRAHNPALIRDKPGNKAEQAPAGAARTEARTTEARTGTQQTASENLTITLNAVTGENAADLVEHHQPDLPVPETIPQWDIAAPGVQLVESTELPIAEVDTSSLTVAETGADLLGNALQFEEPAPIINVDTLSLAPAGAELDVTGDKPQPVEVDISHLKIE